MKAASFDFQKPATIDEAIRILREGGGRTKVISGSQSLGPMLNLRLARPQQVVDVAGLPELRTVREEGGWIRIGAAVTHSELEDGVYPLLQGTLIQTVAGGIAYRGIRNRGTIGGSLAHADPAADWVLVAVALGAQVEIASDSGFRRVDADAFMVGAYTTALAEDDLLTAIWVPKLSRIARWGYHKLCRKTGEFAEASCAAVFDGERRLARIALGALDGAPRLIPHLANQVARTARRPTPLEIRDAVRSSTQDTDPVTLKLRTACVERCLAQICNSEEQQ